MPPEGFQIGGGRCLYAPPEHLNHFLRHRPAVRVALFDFRAQKGFERHGRLLIVCISLFSHSLAPETELARALAPDGT